jgi:hypothetical protein
MMAMQMPVAIDRLELGIAPYCGPFAETLRAEIDAHFAARRLAETRQADQSSSAARV